MRVDEVTTERVRVGAEIAAAHLNPPIVLSDDVKPQHDLDAQRSQGRAWITLAGKKALELAQAEAVVARLRAQIAEAQRKAYLAELERRLATEGEMTILGAPPVGGLRWQLRALGGR